MTFARCFLALVLLVPLLNAQPTPELTPAQAKQDARVLRRALTELHPALTKYRTPAEIEAAFTHFETRAGAASTRAEMFLAASEPAAAVRCGHTWAQPRFNQKPAITALLTERADKLPLHLVLVEARWLVTASATDLVRPGDELLALSDVAAPAIVPAMMPYLRADGSSDGKRLIQLSNEGDTSLMDFIWPLLHPPGPEGYALTVRRSDGTTAALKVPAVTLAARSDTLRAGRPKTEADAWTTEYRDNLCVLTLPTFAFWNSKFDWRAYLTGVFAELAQRGTKNLVIDLRANEGGSGEIGPFILSHLIRTPMRERANQPIGAYERAPYILARYLDTWDYSFFDRTGQVEKLGERRYLLKTKVEADIVITPQPTPFAGKTYILIGANNSSATYLLARLIKASGAATLVGQPTGGNLRGLNGGELCWVNLPNSGVGVDIPLLGSFQATPQPDAGIAPDVAVTRTFAARSAGRDLEMETVLALIAAAPRT